VLEGDDDCGNASISEMEKQKAAHLSITEKRECHHKIFIWVKDLWSKHGDHVSHYTNVCVPCLPQQGSLDLHVIR
jgi:hypothetical protein